MDKKQDKKTASASWDSFIDFLLDALQEGGYI